MIGLIFFIIGVMLGGLTGVVIMCCLQINRLTEREEVKMRKRNVQILFRLTEEEAEQLYSLVQNQAAPKKRS